ncbi:endonuclease, partial [Kribbella turkmenica]
MLSTRRRFAALVAAAALGLTVTGGVSQAATTQYDEIAPAGGGTAQPLHVMSYNLRYASDTPPNEWSARRPVMREQLRSARPQLIGTQEGLYAQLQD